MLLSGAVIPAKWEPPFRPYPLPLVEPLPQRPWIALTFDDGPHAGRTEQLLAVLKKARVPATFFVVGKMADRYPQLLRRISDDGHQLANHTYSHPNLSGLSDDNVIGELEQTRDVIQRLTGQKSTLFRPPGGDFSRRTVRVTSQAGYQMVLWSILSRDLNGTPPGTMRRRILQNAADGGIVLMHSGMPNTIAMLPDLIAQLKDRGFHFVTVSTLLGLPDMHRPDPAETPLLQTAAGKQY
ncbi:MAG: hypothetical protein A2992_00340 [Elusimicrobia bacterium RIFCSPLOWO2_01_FULL_59_12]|nr:MAG: hypothetical protein A2992_00340 [Elusimicrobia bacterium RIFCSPLOWO2_01_FULL_59_12]